MTRATSISDVGERIRWPRARALPLLVVAFVCAAAALTIAAWSLTLVATWFHPLFFWDQWETVLDYHRFLAGKAGVADLFAEHNEHRIAFPRLIFLADFTLGRGLNIINISMISIIQALHAALFAVIARRLIAGPVAAIAMSAVVILMFSFGQAENFIWGFQVQFVGVYAAVTLALWLFALAIERQREGARALGVTLGASAMLIVATYTMSNGVMGGLAAVFIALALRARPALTIGAAALTATLFAAYFYHYHPVASHSPPGFALHHPLEFAAYTLVYLGGVVGAFGHACAGLMGGVGLALTAFAALRLLLRRDRDPARAALTGVMVFLVLTALATAFGRAFFGVGQALSGRYFTPTAVFWSAHVVYLASFVRTTRFRSAAWAAFGVVTLVVSVGAVRAHLSERGYARHHYLDLAFASDALLSDVPTSQALMLVYPAPATLRREAPFLRDHRLSIFSWPEAEMPGKSLSAVYPARDDHACRGAFDITATLGESGGVAVNGWGWDRSRKVPVRRILIVDSHNAIVGFASGWWRRPDVREVVHEVRSRYVGWRGFAKVAGGEPLRAYAVVKGGAAVCLLGARTAPHDDRIGAPPVESELSALGAPIEAKAALSGGWTVNGQHPSAGASPVHGSVFGSWSGSDANQGEIALGPFSAPQGKFALPIVTGPSTGGQSIVVKDAQTGEVYIRFKPAVRVQWSALVLTIPPGKAARPLTLTVTDHGSGWGQWIAVGEPRAVVR